jgi:hypothetical protein
MKSDKQRRCLNGGFGYTKPLVSYPAIVGHEAARCARDMCSGITTNELVLPHILSHYVIVLLTRV